MKLLSEKIRIGKTLYNQYINNTDDHTCITSPVEAKMYTREEFRRAVRQAWIYSCGVVKFEDWFNKNYSE